MKIIQLDEDHFIAVENLPVTEGDYVYSTKSSGLFKADSIEYSENGNIIEDFDQNRCMHHSLVLKVTHSTRPLHGVKSMEFKQLKTQA